MTALRSVEEGPAQSGVRGGYQADDDYEHSDSDAPDAPGPAGARDLSPTEPRRAPEAPPDIFSSRWVTLGDSPSLLIDAPPLQQWLLVRYEHQRDVGVFPRGKTGLLTGTGGTGKTYALLQLALAVAGGEFWFETFRAPERGHVLLALAEEELPECTRRLWRACNALELSADQRREVSQRIHVLPLHGVPVSLLSSPTPNVYEATQAAKDLRRRLGNVGVDWSLLILDPLSRWAGAGAERDNEAATRFVQAAEELTTVRGNPSVILAHHSSKVSIGAGHSDARGVSGLRDAVRWMVTLDVVKTEGSGRAVRLHNDKSNYSPEFEDLFLARNSGAGVEGTLRLASAFETESICVTDAGRQKAKQEKARATFEADCALVLAHLPNRPSHVSITALESSLRAAGKPRSDKTLKGILQHLASLDGGQRVADLSDGAQSKPRQWARTEVG